MCTKSSEHPHSLVSANRHLEESLPNRYVEPLEPFLAIVLTEKCEAQVQGLKYKYPAAFNQWESLPYQKARVFTWGTLEQEHTSRMAYAILQYAHEDEALQVELRNLFKKEFKEIDDYCVRHKQAIPITVDEALFLARKVIKKEDLGCPRSIVKAYAVVDYFVHRYGLTYEQGDAFEETLSFLKRSIRFLLLEYSVKGYNGSMDPIDDKTIKRIKMETKPYIQAYEAKIGMNLLSYCRRLTIEAYWSKVEHRYELGIHRQFGQDIRSLMKSYPMTHGDIEQLMYILLETERREQSAVKYPDKDEFCQSLETVFIPALLEYVYAKATAMDRQYFFRTQGVSDAQMCQVLQKENAQLREETAQYKAKIASVDEQIQQVKDVCQRQFAQQAKNLEAALIVSEQKMRKCEKELAEKDEEIELLKKELEEIKRMDAEWDAFENDQSEEESRWIERLNRPDILIVGCHPRTIHRLKRLLPNVKYYELDTNIQDQYLVGVEHIFVCLHQVNHAMIYKLDRCCGQVPRYPIRKTNPRLILQELAQTLQVA